jgi:hypothetical protein
MSVEYYAELQVNVEPSVNCITIVLKSECGAGLVVDVQWY